MIVKLSEEITDVISFFMAFEVLLNINMLVEDRVNI